jgi:hypothetical protein
MPGEVCEKHAEPRFWNRVRNAVERIKTEHPDYFNWDEPRGGSVLVVNDDAFDGAVVARLNESGQVVAIIDPNDHHEVRVRAADGDAAENYITRTHSANYTAAHYTSTCTPAGF